MSIKLDKYNPLITYLSPASIPQIVAHIQDYLVKHPILSVETIAEIIVQSLQEHPELINGEAIPISADSQQSIKAYIDALPFLDTYTKAEINTLLLGKQDTLTFDQAPTPGSSNPVTSAGIIAAMSALQSALETQISNKADRASTYTKTQVDTLLDDKANADDVYSKNTIDAKLLEINTDIDNLGDEVSEQSQQIGNLTTLETTVKTDLVSAVNEILSDIQLIENTVYQGNVITNTVPASQYTVVRSFTLTPGTYLIIGCIIYDAGFSEFSAGILSAAGSTFATVRGTGNNGGDGTPLINVINLNANTNISLQAYQISATDKPVDIGNTFLKAIKLI